ncbi:uncharacterized protein LOC127001348 [Eriocheir sinensis]|uniref:uncharacterized protein LOC127001348 n=1 Tax=Eriocheir sinensis TaxID=95602 RepID=UPI0021C791F9|nr:uncharacterized protein LOC127001348 [Eriocheir sinensis]
MYTGASSGDVEAPRYYTDMAERGDARRRRRADTATIDDLDEEPVEVRQLCFYHSMKRKVEGLVRFARRLFMLAVVVVVVVHILGLLVNFRVLGQSERPTKDAPRGSYRSIYLSGIRAFIFLLCQVGIAVDHVLKVCEMIPFFYGWVILFFFLDSQQLSEVSIHHRVRRSSCWRGPPLLV